MRPFRIKNLAIAVTACAFLSIHAPAHARRLKKVMLLDFKNILKKKDFDFLEASITNAVREKLRKKFAFEEMEKAAWLEVARENFIVEEDLYTYSAAMNLGLSARQDVVIYGGYVVENRRGSTLQELRTRVRILDLAKKREISDFETQNIVDSTLFDAIERISDRIIKEAAAVLPNADDWARGSVRDDAPGLNQLSPRFIYAPAPLGAANRVISEGGRYAGSDFYNQLGIGLDFQRLGIFSENLGLLAGGFVATASDRFTNSVDGSAAPASLLSFVGYLGPTWRFFPWPQAKSALRNIYLQPLIAGGARYDLMKFTFDTKSIAVTNPQGQSVNQSDPKLLSPLLLIALRAGYVLNSWIFCEVGVLYTVAFYSGGTGQNLAAEVGIGFKL